MNLDHYAHVLRRFRGATWRGDRGQAYCPVHEPDEHPSVSFWLGRDGRLMIGCWANCDKTLILAKVGITWEDCFPPGAREYARRNPVRFVCAYDYRDANGALLYQTVRFDPKDFKRRRPLPGRSRTWAWGLKAGWYAPKPGRPDLYPGGRKDDPGAVELPQVALVLYRLPQLLLARRQTPGRTVLVVAGEKDADTAERVGALATTHVGGESSPWRESYSEALVGADVVVVHDNDAAGLAWAASVCGALVTAACGAPRSLRFGAMPGVGAKGDLTDWVLAVESRGLPVMPAAADAIRGFRCFKRA